MFGISPSNSHSPASRPGDGEAAHSTPGVHRGNGCGRGLWPVPAMLLGVLAGSVLQLCWSTYALYEQNEDLRAEKIELYSRLSTAEREHIKLEELVIKLERKARWRNAR